MDNSKLAIPYLLPFVCYAGIASIPETWLGLEANYMVRIAVVSVALVWAWRQADRVLGSATPALSIGAGIVAGVLGTALWVSFKLPFTGAGGEAWSGRAFWLRLAVSSLVVPFAEELAMRSFVLRFAVSWGQARGAKDDDAFGQALKSSVHEVSIGTATRFAVVVSTLVFTLGHAMIEWPAAIAYGLLMAGLWIWRRDLLTCIVAHAVTNATLALVVWHQGLWDLW